MKTRFLGSLEVSAIGLGCMSMSQAYGRPDPAEAERALERSLEVGFSLLDTASIYGLGHNEKLIGRVLGGKRDLFVLASKCGIVVDGQGRRGVDCSPAAITKTCEESLRNLQTDVIDLYYLHRRDPAVPIEESVGALADLVVAGKIRTIGLSEVSSTTLRTAHAVHPISAVQSEYSLWTRDPENKLLDACHELGVGFVAFSPLARAFLTGEVRRIEDLEEHDMRRHMPRFLGEHMQKNLTLLDEFAVIAADNECTMAQLALAWLLAQRDTLVPIPGTKHVRYVEENAAAADFDIPASDLARAGEIINAKTVSGNRYAKAMMIALDPED